MPVLSENNVVDEYERSTAIFLHVQKLPWTACRSDIKQFFYGIPIKSGGILLRNFEAFVAFENVADFEVALRRRAALLHGRNVQLSIINQEQLRKLLYRIARRKLEFRSHEGVFESHVEVTRQRKIRPTPVAKGSKRAIPGSTFLPKEVEVLTSCYVTNGGVVRYRCDKRLICKKRKVHPTNVSDEMDRENFAIFHPEECHETSNVKLPM